MLGAGTDSDFLCAFGSRLVICPPPLAVLPGGAGCEWVSFQLPVVGYFDSKLLRGCPYDGHNPAVAETLRGTVNPTNEKMVEPR